jgi:HSP20 family protein
VPGNNRLTAKQSINSKEATMAEKAEVTSKGEAVNRPEVRRRNEWFDLPDLFRWEFPDVFRWFDRPGFEGRMRVEEEMKDNAVVIRAEMPGIDPEKDIELTVTDGVLHIKASRRKETKEEDDGRIRSEFRYGSYSRSMPLPKGASADDVKAVYKDGILEVTIPVAASKSEQQKVAVSRG